jgi:AcrR family transcriptional regulator
VATVDRLLDAGLAEFGQLGFDGANLERIACEAGITRPSLLYHFGTKEALYDAAVGAAFARLRDALAETLFAPGTFDERFDAALERYLTFMRARPALAKLVLREIVDERGPGHAMLAGGVPIVEMIERFLLERGRGRLRARRLRRDAILAVMLTGLVQAASGDLRERFWAHEPRTRELARLLLFRNPSRTSSPGWPVRPRMAPGPRGRP